MYSIALLLGFWTSRLVNTEEGKMRVSYINRFYVVTDDCPRGKWPTGLVAENWLSLQQACVYVLGRSLLRRVKPVDCLYANRWSHMPRSITGKGINQVRNSVNAYTTNGSHFHTNPTWMNRFLQISQCLINWSTWVIDFTVNATFQISSHQKISANGNAA